MSESQTRLSDQSAKCSRAVARVIGLVNFVIARIIDPAFIVASILDCICLEGLIL